MAQKTVERVFHLQSNPLPIMHIHSISPFQDRIALTDQDGIALTDQDRRQLKRLLSASAVKVIVSLIDISSVY